MGSHRWKNAPPEVDSGPEPAELAVMAGDPPVEADHPAGDGLVVRPYVRTGGRSRADLDLRMETLLTACAADGTPAWAVTPDLARVRDLCRSPVSVAEISAYMQAPLGVARILISDAVAAGLVLIHETTTPGDMRPSMDLLERVHRGLLELA